MPKKNLQIDQNKLREKFLNKGIKMIAPETIFFSKETVIGKNVTIEPYVVFSKKVKIGNNVTVKSFSHLEGVIVENNVEIGPYARIRPEVRIQKGIGQRSLASKIGVSASYLNDIEKEKRTAPKLNIIKKISSILSIDNKRLNDLAGYSKKSLAPDINDFIVKNPKINSLIRTIQENNLNEKQI